MEIQNSTNQNINQNKNEPEDRVSRVIKIAFVLLMLAFFVYVVIRYIREEERIVENLSIMREEWSMKGVDER